VGRKSRSSQTNLKENIPAEGAVRKLILQNAPLLVEQQTLPPDKKFETSGERRVQVVSGFALHPEHLTSFEIGFRF